MRMVDAPSQTERGGAKWHERRSCGRFNDSRTSTRERRRWKWTFPSSAHGPRRPPTRGASFWQNGQQAELCGELIDSNHKTILQLAQRFGLATVDLLGAQPNGTEDTYYIFGKLYPKDQADADFQPVHQVLQDQVQQTSYPTLYNLFTDAGKFFDNMTVY